MIYELRLYSVAQGRMADVHERFDRYLPALFARHGVNCVRRWSALTGQDLPRFVYLLAYRDYAHREATWAAFYADPEWAHIRAETNAGQEMVERVELCFLKPNGAWNLRSEAAVEPPAGLHELAQHQIAPGQTAAATAFLRDLYLPVLRDAGAHTLGVFDVAAGVGMPKMVLVHAWPDAAAWHEGQRFLATHEGLRAQLAEQRRTLGTTLFIRSEATLFEPAAGAAQT